MLHRWLRDVPYRPMGVLEIFESPWVRRRQLFPKFLMNLCSDRKFKVCSFSSLARTILGKLTLKLWAVLRYAHASFSSKFLMGFYWDGHCERIRAKLQLLTRSGIKAMKLLGEVSNPQSRGRGGSRRWVMVTVRKSVGELLFRLQSHYTRRSSSFRPTDGLQTNRLTGDESLPFRLWKSFFIPYP